jgi:DNA-binding MarR family transcriptional regulator
MRLNKSLTFREKECIMKLYRCGMAISNLAKLLKVDPTTIHRLLNELFEKEELIEIKYKTRNGLATGLTQEEFEKINEILRKEQSK